MKSISILIIDHHRLVREAWAEILNLEEKFDVVAESGSAESGVKAVKTLLPDVVILDIHLPGMNGIDAVPHILEASPASKIIGVSQSGSSYYAHRMIKAGAKGYVSKHSSREEMIEAIHTVQAGGKYISKDIKELIANQFIGNDNADKFSTLSQRELQIIEWIKKGNSSREIGAFLNISTKTVEVHRHNILKKLKLNNTAALINFINKQQRES